MPEANLYVKEAASASNETINFPWRARQIEIINDEADGGADLSWKFNASETYATLKGGETISVGVHSPTLIINTTGPYRVRAYG